MKVVAVALTAWLTHKFLNQPLKNVNEFRCLKTVLNLNVYTILLWRFMRSTQHETLKRKKKSNRSMRLVGVKFDIANVVYRVEQIDLNLR